jgi:hypothetical protein
MSRTRAELPDIAFYRNMHFENSIFFCRKHPYTSPIPASAAPTHKAMAYLENKTAEKLHHSSAELKTGIASIAVHVQAFLRFPSGVP